METRLIDGGPTAQLAEGVEPLGAVWVKNEIYYVPEFGSGIVKKQTEGNRPPIEVTQPKGNVRAFLGLDYISEANALLITGWTGDSFDKAKIIVYSLSTKEERVVVEGGSCARWLSSGYIVFGRGGSLMAIPFDVKTLKRGPGQELLAVRHVGMGTMSGEVHFAAAGNNTVVFAPGEKVDRKRTLLQVDRNGKEEPLPAPDDAYGDVAVSPRPGHRWVAFEREHPETNIWIVNPRSDQIPTQVSHGKDDYGPVWSPDENWLYWTSTQLHRGSIYAGHPDGTDEHRLGKSDAPQWVTSISNDGKTLLATEGSGATSRVVAIPSSGDINRQPLLLSPFVGDDAMLSPDGNDIAFTLKTEQPDGRTVRNVYVRSSRGGNATPISKDGGERPLWSRDGSEIFFIAGNQRAHTRDIVAVGIYAGGFVGKPRVVYRNPRLYGFTLGLDDEHLLVVKSAPRAPVTELRVITKWTPRDQQ